MKDLIRSLRMELEEISGRTNLKTPLSIERKPAIADDERDRFFRRKRRKSAIFGIVGRDIECPCERHQERYVAHFDW